MRWQQSHEVATDWLLVRTFFSRHNCLRKSTMPSFSVSFHLPGSLQNLPGIGAFFFSGWRKTWLLLLVSTFVFGAFPATGVVLWNDPGPTLIHTNGMGTDILSGAVKRDDSASDSLYFKFHAEPLPNQDTEPYF